MEMIPLFSSSQNDDEKKKKKKKKRQRDATVLLDVISRVETSSPRKKQHLQTQQPPLTQPPPPPPPPQAKKPQAEEKEADEPILRLHMAPIDECIELHHLRAWLLLAVEDDDIEDVVLVGDSSSSSSSSSRRHRGFGFAVLKTTMAARRVVESLDGSAVREGCAIVRISPARKPRQRGGGGGKGEGRDGEGERTRRFGELEAALEKQHKRAIAAKVEKGERERREYLEKAEEKARATRAFLAAGGTLPGGFGHGHTDDYCDAANGSGSSSGQAGRGTTAVAPRDRPKLHSGYAHFPME